MRWICPRSLLQLVQRCSGHRGQRTSPPCGKLPSLLLHLPQERHIIIVIIIIIIINCYCLCVLKQDLLVEDVFLLDAYDNVYVWLGNEARPDEKTMAMDAALVRLSLCWFFSQMPYYTYSILLTQTHTCTWLIFWGYSRTGLQRHNYGRQTEVMPASRHHPAGLDFGNSVIVFSSCWKRELDN